jgi:tRNA pseudouridine55 synthase
MTGVLLIDKPSGPTSHDVVARLRRASGERIVGHAGTLDPAATGLLVVLLGKATRLASYLTGQAKTYEADIRFGFATTTDDAQGDRLPDGPSGPPPTDDSIREALDKMTGTIEQLPPQFSAKRVDGVQAYKLARKDKPAAVRPATVTLERWWWMGREDDRVRIGMTTSAGFYVRALARDLGAQLGCGAHLAALRRTGSGRFSVASALSLAEAQELGPALEDRLTSMADALPDFPAVRLSPEGLIRVSHGNPVGPQVIEGPWVPADTADTKVRMLDQDGRLVALADLRGGFLHPSAVLS